MKDLAKEIAEEVESIQTKLQKLTLSLDENAVFGNPGDMFFVSSIIRYGLAYGWADNRVHVYHLWPGLRNLMTFSTDLEYLST